MVNLGRSGGCGTCRERHVKCDEGKPNCRQCLRLGRECGGYGTRAIRLRFKDQSARFYEKSHRTHNRQKKGFVCVEGLENAITPPLPVVEQDVAITFFVTHVSTMGCSLESTGGFFELLPPVLSMERHDSALSLAVAAVATKHWRVLRNSNKSIDSANELLTQTFRRLQTAIQDPVERASGGTILATLMLQFCEDISAVVGRRKVDRTHRDGALALLRHQGLDAIKSKYRGYMLGHLLHVEVSSSIDEKKAFQASTFSGLKSESIHAIPLNPSSILDMIGVSIANHQYRFSQLSSPAETPPSSVQDLGTWWREIQKTDAQLQEWLRTLPDHWHPTKLENDRDIDPSIITYSGTCHIYPSVQIATIWSAWRRHRLILLKIKLALFHDFKPLIQAPGDTMCNDPDEVGESGRCIQDVNDLVDSICYSVPFYLGTRTKQAAFSDVANPRIALPSYHDLEPGEDAYTRYRASDCYMSKEEHKRHALALGPCHLISTLNHLLRLFSDKHGRLLTKNLRPGQVDWIQEQYLRVVKVLRLQPRKQARDIGELRGLDYPGPTAGDLAKVEALSRRVREGLRMMRGSWL